MRILKVESRPQSSTEKAGVPMAVVQRSQLDTPPTSAQPHGMRKKKVARRATTPAKIESQRREVALTARLWTGRPRSADSQLVSDMCASVREQDDLRCSRPCQPKPTTPQYVGMRPDLGHTGVRHEDPCRITDCQ